MPNGQPRRILMRLTAVSLSGTIIALSPGTGCYQALAHFQAAPVGASGAGSMVSPVVPVRAELTNLTLSAPGSASLVPAAPLTLPSAVSPAFTPVAPAAAVSMALPAASPSVRMAAAPAAAALPQAAVQTAAKASAVKAAAAVSAPEGAADRKTALGVLKSAAKGMARSLGINGSLFFDGAGRSARNAIDEEGGHGGAAPSEEAIRAVLSTLRSEIKPGGAFTPDLDPMLADMAGVPHPEMEQVLAELTRRGNLASLTNGARVFVDIPDAAAGSMGAARAAARQGLALLNDGHILAQAKAFNKLRGAVSLYASSVDHGNPAALAEQSQAEILHLNAGLEFMRAYLRQLAERTGKDEDKGTARRALGLVQDGYFAAGHTPAVLAPFLAAWMRKAAARYRPTNTEGEPAQEFANAIGFLGDLAEKMVNKQASLSLVPTSTPKLLTGPAAPKEEGFPLIKKDDKKFENLNKYGSNLTAKAVEGKLSPLVGRKAEIRQMVKTLMRVEKNNPVVIGAKGVGKTKVVEGLAQLIVNGEVPELAGVNIIKLDVTALVAGTQYRGQFEERLKGVMDEAKANKGKVLLFIDELHTIVGLGAASGSQDASQMLKEALSSGDLSLIGATTLEEYRKIEKDGALERRFNPIKLGEPTPAEAVDILEGVKVRYEQKHGVSIPKATVEAAVRLAVRYVKDRSLPDSALDLIDDASAEVALQRTEAMAKGKEPRTSVTADDIAVEINLRTGIPANDLNEDDLASLKKLPEDLKGRIVGQDQAVDAVVKAIRRGRLGYREEKAPIGTFVFLGPTGVGKTEFVRVLAKNQYGSERNIVRIDMSEYQEKHSVSRLVGAPPGYVGHESAGQLTEAVRRNPHTLILLDEIEKAAPEVLDVLLQVIEDGRLTDGQGRVVDFSNAVIVMTSNIGGSLAAQAGQAKRRIGFIQDDAPAKTAAEDRTETYVSAFKAAVRPEFYNRIGRRRVVVFNELGAGELEKILALRIADLNERVKGKGMAVRLTDAAKAHILADAASAENKAYGARPVKQAVEHEVEDALVDAELDGVLKKGDAAVVDYDAAAGKLTVRKDETTSTKSMGGFAILGLAAASAALPTGVVLALSLAGIAGVVAYAVWRVASSYSGPNGRAQAPPTARVWAGRAAMLTAVLLAADWALKGLFFGSGLFVYHHIVTARAIMMAAAIPLNFAFASWMLTMAHADKPILDGLTRFRGRHPVIGGLIYGILQILTFPVGVNDKRHAGDLAGKHPAVAKALGVFVVAAAMVLAGAMGNGIEGLVNHKVVDFIPIGHGRANLSDFLVFLGLPLAWMLLDFFGAVRKAVAARKPAIMHFAKFYAMPVLGMLGYLMASSAGYDAIPLPAVYAAFFSTLFGVGILGGNIYVQKRLDEFNNSLHDGVFESMPAKPAYSLGYRLRRAGAALIAPVMALSIFGGRVFSQPRLAGKDYAALVERYRGRLPKVVITDYDDTFMDNSDGRGLVISDARLKLLEDLKKAGVRVAFATNRPLDGGSFAMSHMLVERMSPELRKDFILSTGGGAEVFKFGPDGSMPDKPYFSGPTITEDERAAISDIIGAEAAKQGVDLAQARTDTKPYEHAWMYGMGLSEEKKAGMPEAEWKKLVAERNRRITAVYGRLQEQLRKDGREFAATLKFPPKEALEPYIRLSKSTKSFAVKSILEIVEAEGHDVDPADVLMLGDDFTVPGYDSAMPKALAAGTAVAVGAAADARIANVHLLTGGPDATERFLRDIIRP